MFPNATVSSRSSSSRSANSCSRNSSMPSLRMRNPLSPKTSFNPLFRHSDALTSFDASHFVFDEQRRDLRGKHPVLRRYNSHDSQANFGDVRIESRGNTSESAKSRASYSTPETTSPDSTGDRSRHELEARDFLERYSLPRVVKVGGGEPLLLYRCFDSFTKVQARGLIGKKGKEKADANNVLHFPEGYSGWFSLTNEKGEKSAVAHTSVLQLVREQVCSFISIQPFNAYAAHSSDPGDLPGKVQYLKTQVRGGQLFQLRAVFQHKDRPDGGKNSTRSSRVSQSARDKDLSNRYAQIISQTNQELYVPLTTKGEFYEIHSSIKARLCFPGLLHKTGPLALDKDCLYKLTHLLRRVALPVKVKLLAGPLPQGLPKDFTDTFILEKKFQEPLMVTCTLPLPSENTHKISCIKLNSGIKIVKCTLGYDSESRLFQSQRLQAALAFCHKNVENWYREVRLAPNLEEDHQPISVEPEKHLQSFCSACVKLNKPCSNSNCKWKEVEYSSSEQKQIITKEVLEKFPKSKKWYKHLKIMGPNGEPPRKNKRQSIKDGGEGSEKVKSIERYKDMSKLIEEKFGKKSYNPVKKSASFMFSNARIDLEEVPSRKKNNPALLKCQSLDTQLQHFEIASPSQKADWNSSKSNISDLSYDFQMCILENESSFVETRAESSFQKAESQSKRDVKSIKLQVSEMGWDEIKEVDEIPKLKKTKPDLIPTLPKQDHPEPNSYITERLCNEFHVKTKVQRKSVSKQNLLELNDKVRSSARIHSSNLSVFDVNAHNEKMNKRSSSKNVKSVVVQVHEGKQTKVQSQRKKSAVNIDDVPYSHVADEVCQKPSGHSAVEEENIYAEICETPCKCDTNKLCDCKRTKKDADYYYVKLGSNGDSVTQSDSDEAIYNTLR